MTFDLDWHDAPDPRAPLVGLIHGLGVTGGFWRDPVHEPLAGGLLTAGDLVPLPTVVRVVATGRGGRLPRWVRPADLEPRPSPWKALAAAGLSLAAYTQANSHAAMPDAVAELAAVLAAAERRRPLAPLVLVGHSRGGLIARRLVETRPEAAGRVRALITLGSPHAGSGLALIASRCNLAIGALGALLARAIALARGPAAAVRFLRQVGSLARSPAIREIIPRSPFLASLAADGPPGLSGYSVVGTCPTTVRCYRSRHSLTRRGMEARAWLTLPDALARGPGGWLVPEEWHPGRGDGSVGATRGRLPWAREHRAVPCNHMALVVEPAVQAQILAWIRDACGPWRAGEGFGAARADAEAPCLDGARLL